MKSIEDLSGETKQRIKVLEALGYVPELEGGSVRQVKEALGRVVEKFDEEFKGIVVLPLGYDNLRSFCELYNVYVMPIESK